jgi:hypothetical protein
MNSRHFQAIVAIVLVQSIRIIMGRKDNGCMGILRAAARRLQNRVT